MLSVLWIAGPSGSGKTTVGWNLWRQSDARTAFVDIDQVGMVYPEASDDPMRYRLKIAVLTRLATVYERHGVTRLIVSGITDPTGADLAALPVPTVVCRLRAHSGLLRDRLIAREGEGYRFQPALDDAELLEGSGFADAIVDTTGLTPAAVVRAVTTAMEGITPRVRASGDQLPTPPPVIGGGGLAGHSVVWIRSSRAVGSSTVGFELFRNLFGEGQKVAYIDLAQVGFVHDATVLPELVKEAWSVFKSYGAGRLILVGMPRSPIALPAVNVLLTADGPARRARALERAGRVAPFLAGDDLHGMSEDDVTAWLDQDSVSDGSLAEDMLTLDTSRLTPSEAAAVIRTALNW